MKPINVNNEIDMDQVDKAIIDQKALPDVKNKLIIIQYNFNLIKSFNIYIKHPHQISKRNEVMDNINVIYYFIRGMVVNGKGKMLLTDNDKRIINKIRLYNLNPNIHYTIKDVNEIMDFISDKLYNLNLTNLTFDIGVEDWMGNMQKL